MCIRDSSYLAGINARCLTGITVQCVGSCRRRSLPRPALSISNLRPITDFSPTSERFYSLRWVWTCFNSNNCSTALTCVSRLANEDDIMLSWSNGILNKSTFTQYGVGKIFTSFSQTTAWRAFLSNFISFCQLLKQLHSNKEWSGNYCSPLTLL